MATFIIIDGNGNQFGGTSRARCAAVAAAWRTARGIRAHAEGWQAAGKVTACCCTRWGYKLHKVGVQAAQGGGTNDQQPLANEAEIAKMAQEKADDRGESVYYTTTEEGFEAIAVEPTVDVDEGTGALRRYDDASYIRPATREERADSLRAERDEPGATGVIVVDGVRCYVAD